MIELFPERMLDSSIHTAILIGVGTLWLLTESLGFVFAGFIVAGYLAAITAVAPMSTCAIALEAVLTYGGAHALGRGLPSLGLWHHAFGRERFLLFVVVSIPVRLFVEGLAAPGLEVLLQPLLDDPVWRGGRFFGIGVVLVPLLANAFWKVGLARGAGQVALCTAVTWAALTQVLTPLTNFHFGAFEATFEGIATDFLAVPKVYVVLVVTAAVAARFNLRFGWDFGGILVPALLAVVALTPAKLVATIVEIAVLVACYRLLVGLPSVRRWNLEGPRRIVSMYAVAYALKALIAWGATWLELSVVVSDFYGFGYLLTALVALRCTQQGSAVRTLGSLLATTGTGLALALPLSVGLAWLWPGPPVEPPSPPRSGPTPGLERSILEARAAVRTDGERPPSLHLERHLALLRGLARGGGTVEDALARLGRSARVGLVEASRGARCLRVGARRWEAELEPALQAAWWCGGSGPVLYVPQPVSDPDSLAAAAWLADRAPVSMVVVEAGDSGASGDVARLRRVRRALGADQAVYAVATGPGRSWLDPRSSRAELQPPFADLVELDVRFDSEHGALQPLWSALLPTDAVLRIGWDDLDAAHGDVPVADALGALLEGLEVPTWSASSPGGTASSPEARAAVVDLLVGRAIAEAPAGGALPRRLAAVAGVFGVAASTVREGDAVHWVLHETAGAPRGFGAWVIRSGPAAPRVVAAPMSADEPGTGALAHRLYDELGGRAVWLSLHGARMGSRSALDLDLGDLPLGPLALRAALHPEPEPVGLVLVRRQSSAAPGTERVVLSLGEEAVLEEQRSHIRALLGPALRHFPGAGFQDGRAETLPMSAFGQFPLRYVDALSGPPGAVVWVEHAVLGELPGTPDHAVRDTWYRARGLEPVASLEHAVRRADPDSRIEPPTEWALQRLHVDALDGAALAELQRRVRVTVVHTGVRYALVARGAGWVCVATAGGGDVDAWPAHGCRGAP